MFGQIPRRAPVFELIVGTQWLARVPQSESPTLRLQDLVGDAARFELPNSGLLTHSQRTH